MIFETIIKKTSFVAAGLILASVTLFPATSRGEATSSESPAPAVSVSGRIDNLFTDQGTTGSVVRNVTAPAFPEWSSLKLDMGASTDPDAFSRRELLKKQPVEAFWRSMILPGWGHRYSDRPGRGSLYTSIDALLWTGFFWSQQSWKMGENTYTAYADQHASISSGRDHDFYVDIGNYDNRDEFNMARRQQRDYVNQYTGSDTWWEWDSSENRLTFKDLRIVADRHKNRMYYLAGGLLLNRILSAIDAGRGLSAMQSKLREQTGLSLEFDAQVGGPSLVWRGNLGR